MDTQQKTALINYFFTLITANKREKMDLVIQNRTRHVSVLLEDIFQQHNASAVIRSAECFGVQDLHIVQDRFKFNVNAGVAMGSAKWISMHSYPKINQAYQELKNQGYRIVATTPHEQARNLEDLPLDEKLVLVFGTENIGLSPWALEYADEFVKIPMVGFTESFNISVSVALCLFHITSKLRSSSIAWQLDDEEKLDVYLTWLRRAIRGSHEYEKIFLNSKI